MRPMPVRKEGRLPVTHADKFVNDDDDDDDDDYRGGLKQIPTMNEPSSSKVPSGSTNPHRKEEEEGVRLQH